ncbi:SDR family oxidoreductase [Ruegeria sp. THAF33]|uniref:SDR family oxidoreductase n=1 Tax=Ruegeria sp. THAF33 TaxID=2587853 RepID=UPI001268165F|nr:SDR family oxidoreductase [Ruegeria sp. THAF33]QFT74851.1 NmrA-like family protein [Ruegeria sp. THAF33]
MKTVFIAGATGYLGRHIAKLYLSSGWHVRALVRNSEQARVSGLDASEYFVGEATRPETLRGAMDGVDLVISSLGITRQRDGLTYEEVDYQANVNLLEEALAAKVGHFAYIHVLNADKMPDVPLVAAKQAFADRLDAAPITSTIVAPSGFFSDMADFLNMAKSGRVWLFGTGHLRLNPIDGSDLARVVMSAIEEGRTFVPVGGPDIFTQTELAEAAFAALGQPAKITYLPDLTRRLALKILPWVTPAHVHGPALFFLSAMGHEMVGEPTGIEHIADHFNALVAEEQ